MAPKRTTRRGGRAPASQPSTSARQPTPPPPPPPSTASSALGFELRDEAEKSRFDFLIKRRLVPSKRIEWDLLRKYNIADEFAAMLDSMRWLHLSRLSRHTYRHLTLEFMATVRAAPISEDHPAGTLLFRLKNREYSVTPSEMAEFFVTGDSGFISGDSEEFFEDEYWHEMSGFKRFNSQSSKESELKSRMLRLIHRFTSYAIQMKGESNEKVTKEDLFLLWCASHGRPVHTGRWMCERLLACAKKDKGTITVGAYITHIAAFMRVPLTSEDDKHIEKFRPFYDSIGTNTLKGMKILVVEGKTKYGATIYKLAADDDDDDDGHGGGAEAGDADDSGRGPGGDDEEEDTDDALRSSDSDSQPAAPSKRRRLDSTTTRLTATTTRTTTTRPTETGAPHPTPQLSLQSIMDTLHAMRRTQLDMQGEIMLLRAEVRALRASSGGSAVPATPASPVVVPPAPASPHVVPPVPGSPVALPTSSASPPAVPLAPASPAVVPASSPPASHPAPASQAALSPVPDSPPGVLPPTPAASPSAVPPPVASPVPVPTPAAAPADQSDPAPLSPPAVDHVHASPVPSDDPALACPPADTAPSSTPVLDPVPAHTLPSDDPAPASAAPSSPSHLDVIVDDID